jgi:hypothetical protein
LMEEMEKAKTRAEEERAIYRNMLEQAHERALREKHELRLQAQSKLEASAARNTRRKQRIALLEKELKEKGQVEEEKNAFKEQYRAVMEVLAAQGASVQLPPSSSIGLIGDGGGGGSGGAGGSSARGSTKRDSLASPGGAGGFFGSAMERVRSQVARARASVAEHAHDHEFSPGGPMA